MVMCLFLFLPTASSVCVPIPVIPLKGVSCCPEAFRGPFPFLDDGPLGRRLELLFAHWDWCPPSQTAPAPLLLTCSLLPRTVNKAAFLPWWRILSGGGGFRFYWSVHGLPLDLRPTILEELGWPCCSWPAGMAHSVVPRIAGGTTPLTRRQVSVSRGPSSPTPETPTRPPPPLGRDPATRPGRGPCSEKVDRRLHFHRRIDAAAFLSRSAWPVRGCVWDMLSFCVLGFAHLQVVQASHVQVILPVSETLD